MVQKIIGRFLRVEWVERKAEWVSEQYFLFRREDFTVYLFWFIPILWAKMFTARMQLTGFPYNADRPKCRSLLKYQLECHQPNVLLWLVGWLLLRVVLLRFKIQFWIYDWQINSRPSPPKHRKLRWGAAKKIAAARQALVIEQQKIEPKLWDTIVEWLETYETIRPRERAQAQGLDWHAVLKALVLMATRDLVTIHYDSICQSCRGVKETKTTFKAINPVVPCESCAARYPLTLHQTLEVVAGANPNIAKPRRSQQPTHCLSSPMHSQHIQLELELDPDVACDGIMRRFSSPLESGWYRIRVLGSSAESRFEVVAGSDPGDLFTVVLHRGDQVKLEHSIAYPRQTLCLVNYTGKKAVVVIEQEAWRVDMVSALDLVMLGEFRYNFPSECLPWEVVAGLSMGSGAVGFCDLEKSTTFWALAQDQVQAAITVRRAMLILEKWVESYHGAVLKTTGDGIMALFRRRSDGVLAWLQAQHEIHTSGLPFRARFGLHYGSVFLGSSIVRQFDIMNSIVNFAARLEGKVDLELGDHVVVSQAVREGPRVQALKRDGLIRVEAMGAVALKGVPDEHELFRVYPTAKLLERA
ncbi:adenylate/guanylate cyclase domain-containing protein [Candidatus Uhrbacteria bacterium]|nr:adenylate/guanylate cyclase domain-containing protein [Candidatus Uhrbacteria bacterium]